MDSKVMENRLRRVAARCGMRLAKSRRRDPQAIDFGGYMLIDVKLNAVMIGGGPYQFSASLDDIRDWLS
jgi:hypothetical protein